MPLMTYEKLLTGLDLYYITVFTKNPNILSIYNIEKENDYFEIVKIGEFVKPGSADTIYVIGMIIKNIERKDIAIKSFMTLIVDKDYDAIIHINQNTYYNTPSPESKFLKNPTIKYWEG